MQARRDQNAKPVSLAVSSSDNSTPLMLTVNPSTNFLLTENYPNSVIVTSSSQDKRDQNTIPTVYGISSIDGVTLIPIKTDINGNLLIE